MEKKNYYSSKQKLYRNAISKYLYTYNPQMTDIILTYKDQGCFQLYITIPGKSIYIIFSTG